MANDKRVADEAVELAFGSAAIAVVTPTPSKTGLTIRHTARVKFPHGTAIMHCDAVTENGALRKLAKRIVDEVRFEFSA